MGTAPAWRTAEASDFEVTVTTSFFVEWSRYEPAEREPSRWASFVAVCDGSGCETDAWADAARREPPIRVTAAAISPARRGAVNLTRASLRGGGHAPVACPRDGVAMALGSRAEGARPGGVEIRLPGLRQILTNLVKSRKVKR
ncbi:hypothetical protein GCM10023196_034980 [Actinoallomurus vinaceus]|uniref:Uncharacterized protein n=1 Tax=Actinoallomurus vinaceus TaxID=1080074 RepID=A0ABP8UC00_9ACTN